MTQIQNVAGTPMGVTDDYRAQIEGFGRGYHLVCTLAGWAFTHYDNVVTPVGAGDYFAKLQNDSADLLYITGLTFLDAGADVINMHVSPAFASGGTHDALVPVNRYSGSANLAWTKGVFESGIDITGSTDTQVAAFNVAAGVQLSHDMSDSPLILGPNQAMVLEIVGSGDAIRYAVDFFFGVVPTTNA